MRRSHTIGAAPVVALLICWIIPVAASGAPHPQTRTPGGIAPPSASTRTPNDFDGDGFADVAVGAPGESVGVVALAGAVNVLYGTAAGISVAGNQLWTQASKGVAGDPGLDDAFGGALATGDFDGDGFTDVAVGVRRDDLTAPGPVTDAGAVNVLYGSASGLSKAGAQYLIQAGADPDAAPEDGDRFGWALAAGDFDADGFADLAVGAPDEAIGFESFAGAVTMFPGSATGLSSTEATFWSETLTGAGDGSESTDSFGSALTAGDFDGDGSSDLAIGVRLENVGSLLDAGAAIVLYGSPAGVTAGGSQSWSQDSPGVQDAAEEDDRFASALAAGDFDGDGADDLALGVPAEDVNGVADAGGVNVLQGSPAGLTSTRNRFWSQDTGGVQESADFLDVMGTSLAAGDFDGDGSYRDLAIGVQGEPAPAGAVGAGGINVLYGSASGLTKTGNRFLWQDTGGFDDAAEPSDYFGSSLSAADMGFGPEDDLAVGVKEEELMGAPTGAGAVHFVYGSPLGLIKDGNKLISQDTPGMKDIGETGDLMGSALAAG